MKKKNGYFSKNPLLKYVLLFILCIAVIFSFYFWFSGSVNKHFPSKKRYEPQMDYAVLENGEKLELIWKLENEFLMDTKLLDYKVEWYDSDQRLRLSMSVDVSEYETDSTSRWECPAIVYFYEDGERRSDDEALQKNIDLSLTSYIDDAYRIHMTIDAVDLKSDDVLNLKSDDLHYDQTDSAMRLVDLGIFDVSDHFFVRVGPKKDFDAGIWSETEMASLLMGQESSGERYLIQNARHFYNIRFIESYRDKDTEVVYLQTDTFEWYPDIAFPTIRELGYYSRFYTENDVQIHHLKIEWDGTHTAAGIFSRNYGVIEGLNLCDVYIDAAVLTEYGRAAEAVGAICGINRGSIADVTVDGGLVTGINDVGGIAGRWESASDSEALVNGAQVTGKSYVGGIVGRIKNQYSDHIRVIDCMNKALVLGKERYVGGITGYACKVDFISLISSPEYMADAAPNWYASMDRADYVGGIVGYAVECSIEQVETGPGYIIGYDYVGGIAGAWMAEDTEGIIFDGDQKSNGALVAGHDYVGGILGRIPSGTIVQNWKNEGYICSDGSFSGGITGENRGIIQDCRCEMPLTSETEDIVQKYFLEHDACGDYVGGLAGINWGSILSSDLTQIQAVLNGRNYVGGIVGHNSKYGQIENYALGDGYIQGHCFVGGFAGVNESEALMKTEMIAAAPTLVQADYCAGGVIGANILESCVTSLTTRFLVDNEKGEVICDGPYAGGLVGIFAEYIYLNYMAEGSIEQRLIDAVEPLLSDIDGHCGDIVQATKTALDELGYLSDRMHSWCMTGVSGDSSANHDDRINLGMVRGSVYVGGALGYNHSGVWVTIRNLCNHAQIEADSVIETADGSYAFAGGITGIVDDLMRIDHCMNEESVVIHHLGSWLGGIAEINEGIITECESDGLSTDEAQGLGGIVGINMSGGKLISCVQNKDVQGHSQVGGITALNHGMIVGAQVNGKVTGDGSCIGGVAGKSDGVISGSVVCEDVISMGTGSERTVKADGNCVGGIVGYNQGSVRDCENREQTVKGQKYVGGFIGFHSSFNRKTDDSVKIENMENHAFVEGVKTIGGIVGYVQGQVKISRCIQNGSVTAQAGIAGGIAAYVGEGASLLRCENQKDMILPYAEAAGGIAGQNDGRIEQCTISEKIKIAGSGVLGGIAGKNNGVISSCTLKNFTLMIQGGDENSAVGGICGTNTGSVQISGTSDDEDIFQGDYINISTNTSDSCIGGITGINRGNILGLTQNNNRSAVKAAITVKSNAEACVGGIAGHNLGTISDYMFVGYIHAAVNEKYGIGGIAGMNGIVEGDDLTAAKAVIRNCLVKDSRLNKMTFTDKQTEAVRYRTIWVFSEEDDQEKRSDVSVGGIAGVNGVNGLIQASTLKQCCIYSDQGYVGGICAWNYGKISKCMPIETKASAENAEINSYKVKIYCGQVSAVPIAFNKSAAAEIDDCKIGKDWIVIKNEDKK